MFTTGSKYYIALSALASVAIAVYLIFVGPSSIGATARFGMIAATGLLAGLALYTRDSDTESPTGAQAASAAPSASMWPVVSVLGAVVLLLGTVTTPIVFVLGIVVLATSFVEWVVQAWSERASGDVTYNDSVRKLNSAIVTIPGKFFVGFANVTEREFYEVDDPQARAVPKVQF